MNDLISIFSIPKQMNLLSATFTSNFFTILGLHSLLHLVALSLCMCSLVMTITQISSSMLMIGLHLASKILPLKSSLRLLSIISHLSSLLKKARHQCLASIWNSASKPSFVSCNIPHLANLKLVMLVFFAICQNYFCNISPL